MIKARLESGQVVVLEKDCHCITHDGPHWLHMDRIDRSLNDRYKARAMEGHPLAVRAYAQLELRRLKEKESNMNARRIVEILGDAKL